MLSTEDQDFVNAICLACSMCDRISHWPISVMLLERLVETDSDEQRMDDNFCVPKFDTELGVDRPRLTVAYNAALAACRNENVALAEHLLKQMRTGKVEPNSITFGTMLGCAWPWKEAVDLFATMQNLNIPQSESAYTSMMKACRWQVSLFIWQEFQLDPHRHGHSDHAEYSFLSAKIFSSLVSSFCRDVQWQRALEMALPQQNIAFTGRLQCRRPFVDCFVLE